MIKHSVVVRHASLYKPTEVPVPEGCLEYLQYFYAVSWSRKSAIRSLTNPSLITLLTKQCHTEMLLLYRFMYCIFLKKQNKQKPQTTHPASGSIIPSWHVGLWIMRILALHSCLNEHLKKKCCNYREFLSCFCETCVILLIFLFFFRQFQILTSFQRYSLVKGEQAPRRPGICTCL